MHEVRLADRMSAMGPFLVSERLQPAGARGRHRALHFLSILLMMVLGFASVTFGPLILGFVGWMMLNRWAPRERRERMERAERIQVIEARVVRDEAPPYPAAAVPARAFDLLLSAEQDIGRIRGAAVAIEDAADLPPIRSSPKRPTPSSPRS